MTDNDLSCGVDALAPARGDAAPTHMPRSESPSRLAGLLPTREVRGRNNRATDKDEGTRNTKKKGKKVRGKVQRGKKVSKEKEESGKKVVSSLKVMHWNAEGVMNKADALKIFLHENDVDVCLVQETHLQEGRTLRIRGYQLFRNDRQGRSKGGVLTLVRNNIHAIETKRFSGEAEYIQLKITAGKMNLDITNFYCPDTKQLSLDTINMAGSNFLIAGDFNSHSQSWGYDEMNRRGEEVENWQDENKLLLINQAWDTPTFYSRVWHSSTTPDIALCTEDLHQRVTREVCPQLAGSDHRPVMLSILESFQVNQPQHPRWNWKKAQWGLFGIRASELTKDIQVENKNPNTVYQEWANGVLDAAKETIPRGVTKNYEPHWNPDLQKAHDALNKAREEAENYPGQENHIKLQRCKAEYKRKNIESKRKSWREMTGDLNMEKDTKLWRLVKTLNEEGCGHQPISLDLDGEILTEKRAANKFGKSYEEVCNINVPTERRNEVRIEEAEILSEEKDVPDIMTQKITMPELQKAIKKLKKKKAPGPDGITNEMLMYLTGASLKKLLEIFNLTWEKGDVPQQWKEAIMIPLLKKGKNKSKPLSYRPISLTSCVCKTMERIINERLQWYLESESILTPEQAGFRQYRSTEDQTTHLAQVIQDAFKAGKVVLASFIDLQKAFDKVWKDGLSVKLVRSGIRGNMLRWTKSYLHNRKARVLVNGHTGRKVLLRHGVPQGGVLSPTLFILFINDVVKELPKGVKAALYADDLVLWCTEEETTTATHRMQMALDKITAWTEKWCLQINKEKSAATLFTLKKQKPEALMLGETPLQYADESIYLGVTYDKHLTWKVQITNAEAKARKKLSIMRKLAGTNWGANEKILKQVYQGNVRHTLEYGSSSYMTAASTHLNKLEKVQNQALRVITGAMRSTPIDKMQKITGIPPLSQRFDCKALTMYTKAKAMKDHPLHDRTLQRGPGRLKRQTFVGQAKVLEGKFREELPSEVEEIKIADDWKEASPSFKVQTSVPGLSHKEDDNKEQQRLLTLEMMDLRYPQEAWTQIYTDGSASNAVRNGGAGVFIHHAEGGVQRLSEPTGIHCTNYKAEIEALIVAAKNIENDIDQDGQVVFLTDALSVLQNLENNGLPHLRAQLNKIKCSRITLQWIPAHCGIFGNEEADRLAKLGAGKEQPDTKASYHEMKTLIKALHRPIQLRDGYHGLKRSEQVTIFRLRTGHNRLNKHMYHRFRIAESPGCPCGAPAQNEEHILQQCPTYDDLRRQFWPERTSIEEKLYGTTSNLRKTATFITETGLSL